MKKVKRKLPQKRHVEDVPFYQFKYKFDELPLDPAFEFIRDHVGKHQPVAMELTFRCAQCSSHLHR